MLNAVGCHVFAGGFTVGVQKRMKVDVQLERHGFGLDTARAMCGVDCVEYPWPKTHGDLLYGNPRCTGFSTITAGYSPDCHGPYSKQCQDIWDLCLYGIEHKFPVIIWESVQQAFSTGRPLLDKLRDEHFVPAGYRIAHLLLNAASFGNCQQRKRYFFVAYKRENGPFNISPPDIDGHLHSVYDAIWKKRMRQCREGVVWSKDAEYDEDCYARLTPDEKVVVPLLPNGMCLNEFARWQFDDLPQAFKNTWTLRDSNMPFSMHCIGRTQWLRPSPTLHSSASRFIHPTADRPLSIGELATIMGWPQIPVGPNPIGQIAKGIVPAVGTWLAEQVGYHLSGAWGKDDYESSYNAHKCEWIGDGSVGKEEKVFNLTAYCGQKGYDLMDHDAHEVRECHLHRLNVDFMTRELRRPWDQVRAMTQRYGKINGNEVNWSKYASDECEPALDECA